MKYICKSSFSTRKKKLIFYLHSFLKNSEIYLVKSPNRETQARSSVNIDFVFHAIGENRSDLALLVDDLKRGS